MQLPLTQWTLRAENLPQRLFDAPKSPAFFLPGAAALDAFADLIGGQENKETAALEEGVPYALDGALEDDLQGEVRLSREMDFGSLPGDRALLTFSQLLGSGEILLGEAVIARFGGNMQQERRRAYDMTGVPCALAVDLSDALHLGRKETLTLRFDASRPAGVTGTPFLCTTARAHLSRVSIQPDALRRTMTVRARISAQQAGRYVLRVQAVPDRAGAALEPARETDVSLSQGQATGVQLSLSVDAPAFVPGKPYAAPALKIQLFAQSEKEKQKEKTGLLCDETLLLCGYGGAAPGAYLPLNEKMCKGDPQAICRRMQDLGIAAVSLPAGAPERLFLALTRAGIAATACVSEEVRPMYTRYPCLTLSDAPLPEENLSPAAAAWQMTGSVSFPRAVDSTLTDEEMILEASGRRLDIHSVSDALSWLRTVQIRLRAEAARQGRYRGALCSAQESGEQDVIDALRTAFSPVHLSALPLNGAWWTGTRFSASLEAFIPENGPDEAAFVALCILEDDDGAELARFEKACTRSGYAGVLDAQLPDTPCVLTLRCALLRGGKVIEESVLPVYVGERGPLEAAF